jgi:hypothetical protein
MFSALLDILAEALKLWNTKEKTKYQDRYLSLKRDYYAEQNKDADSRSDAVLDNLEFELRILGHAVAAGLREQNTQNQS